MKTLYLCGVGNGEGIRLALTVNQAQARWQRVVLLDDDAAKHGTIRLGLEVAGAFACLAQLDPSRAEVVNLVTRTTQGRANANQKIAQYGVPFASLIHPGVELFGTELGDAVTIYQNASIGAEASIEDSSVVLVGAVVGHGARIGKGCVIAPNAVINARVVLGDGVYVGSNASILPDLTIGAGATIAANSLVYADVPAGATALGVPAQIIGATPVHADAGAGHSAFNDSGKRTLQVADGNETACAEIEQAIVHALQSLLRLDGIDRTANFFDLGCTSLKALELCQRLRDGVGLELQVVDVYRFPTAHALALHLGGGSPEAPTMQHAQQRAELRRQVRSRR